MIFLGLAQSSIQLVPDGTLFLHIAIILIMIGVLNATLFKPINRILEEREKRTRGRSIEASDIMKRVEQRLSMYEQKLREARAESYRLLEKEHAEALRERQIKLEVIRGEIEALTTEQTEIINRQAAASKSELKRDSERIAQDVSAQILGRPVESNVPSAHILS